MKLKYVLILCFFIQSCGAAEFDYYVALVDGKESVNSTLYKGDHLLIDLEYFDGEFSKVYFSNANRNENLNVQILKYEHSLKENEEVYFPDSSYGYELGTVSFPEGKWGFSTFSGYQLAAKPESLTETISIELLVEGQLISISEEFTLKKVTYGHFEALMNR